MNRRINLAAVSLLGAAAPTLAQPFPVTGIGNLQGGPSIAWSISSWAGPNFTVVGETDTNNSIIHKACTFTNMLAAVNNGSGPGGNFKPEVAYRIAHAPNFQVHVGAGVSASLSTRAFRTNGGVTVELGTLNPFLQNSEARGINSSGVVVGTCYAMNSYPGDGNNNSFAFQWVPTGLPTSNTGTMSMIPLHAANDVNDAGVAVGTIGSSPYRLIIASNTLTNLGSLGGTMAGNAMSINNAGVIVGNSPSASTGLQHAFRWTPSGGMQDIHPVPLIGGTGGTSFAYDVEENNGLGSLIVGRYYSAATGSNGHAFVYNPVNGAFRDLNTWLPANSGWVLESAYGINDAHCIAGRGRRNGQLEGFRMCVTPPVPGAPPCGGTLNPLPNAAMCPGGTLVFNADPAPVGGMPAEFEWSAARRVISSNEIHHNRVVDGLNTDPDTGEPLFMAAINAGGRQLSITPIPAPGTVPHIGEALIIGVLVRGPCDTLYAPAATALVSPADVGVQGGGPGKDGLYDNNDFVSFIDLFFTGSVAADLGMQGGLLGPDGQHDNNDFVVFIDEFFHACG